MSNVKTDYNDDKARPPGVLSTTSIKRDKTFYFGFNLLTASHNSYSTG